MTASAARDSGAASPVPAGARPSAVSQLREGLRYTRRHPTIRTLIVNLGLVGLLGMSMLTLLPAWSVEVLHGDVRTNGMLLSARGVGAVCGALLIAAVSRRGVRPISYSRRPMGSALGAQTMCSTSTPCSRAMLRSARP